MSAELKAWIGADFNPAREDDLARRFNLSEADYLKGSTYSQAAEICGLEYEIILPAGTLIQAGDHRLILQAAVAVRTVNPITVIEGAVLGGSGAESAWPAHIRMAMVNPGVRNARKVSLAYVDLETVPENKPADALAGKASHWPFHYVEAAPATPDHT